MTIKKQNGFVIISEVIGTQRMERKYMGYTIREAVMKFKQEFGFPSRYISAHTK